jgi:starch synthase
VYAHSGLEDTVSSYATNKQTPTGFTFSPYTGEGLLEGLDDVREVWKDTAEWKKLAFRCMRQDFSWEETASQYMKHYRTVSKRLKAELEGLA